MILIIKKKEGKGITKQKWQLKEDRKMEICCEYF